MLMEIIKRVELGRVISEGYCRFGQMLVSAWKGSCIVTHTHLISSLTKLSIGVSHSALKGLDTFGN